MRCHRRAFGCELSADFLALSFRRLCSNLVQVELSVACLQFSVDPFADPVDRSDRAEVAPLFCNAAILAAPLWACHPDRSEAKWRDLSSISPRPKNSTLSPHLQLVQSERRFYFIGRTDRSIIFSVVANSLDEALQKFHASGHSSSDTLFIIKTETEIYLA